MKYCGLRGEYNGINPETSKHLRRSPLANKKPIPSEINMLSKAQSLAIMTTKQTRKIQTNKDNNGFKASVRLFWLIINPEMDKTNHVREDITNYVRDDAKLISHKEPFFGTHVQGRTSPNGTHVQGRTSPE